VSLFFSIIPKHVDGLVSSWHEFKNTVAAEVGILPFVTTCKQSFSDPDYCRMSDHSVFALLLISH